MVGFSWQKFLAFPDRKRLATLCLSIMPGLLGCSAAPELYIERHEIQTLTVVFLDRRSLQREWKELTGREHTLFLPRVGNASPAIKTIKGFYDFDTNTLYCQKWDFKACGHELHHAVLGEFHLPD